MSRILVVDDDRDMRVLLGTYLEASGHHVDFASDGLVGIDVIARSAPDLVITDFQMPRMDGFGLFNAVRSQPGAGHIPVIMITAHSSRELMQKALSAGIDDFLGKPVTRDELMRVVTKALHPPAAAAPAAPGLGPTDPEFFGSLLCCEIRGIERFAMVLLKEELEELLEKFKSDVAAAAADDAGWVVRADFHNLYGVFEDGVGPAKQHALRALRSALKAVLAAQRLKPWILSRFRGRDVPEFVVAVGVHTGKVQCTMPAHGKPPELQGESAYLAKFLVQCCLKQGWSVGATRTAAKAADFAFAAGRGTQVHEPKSGGSIKIVEVCGLEQAAAPTIQARHAAALIEAAVHRNANLVNFAEAPRRAAEVRAASPTLKLKKAGPKAPLTPIPTLELPELVPPAPAAPPAMPPPQVAAPRQAAASRKPQRKPARKPAAAVPPPAAPAPAAKRITAPPPAVANPLSRYTLVRKLADNGVVAVNLLSPVDGGPQQVQKTILINDDKHQSKRPHLLRFLEQYAAIRGIEHPNVARVSAEGLTATHLYVIQEYCPGGDLRNLIAEKLSPDEAIKALMRIAVGLKAAHQRGFVHGDLKPANIMIRADGSFAIVDFALSRVVEYAIGEGDTSVLVRSPDYLSPEMINNQPADVQSDVYTVGLLLYELLTGQRAYASPDLSCVMRDHLTAPVPKLPEPLARFQPLLDKLMAKKREERFESMAAMIAFAAEAKLLG